MKPLSALLLGILLGILLATSALAEAPEKRNELFLGVGDASTLFSWQDIAVTIASLGIVTYGDPEGGFVVVCGYQRHLGRWASLGVTASWASATREMFFLRESEGDVNRGMQTFLVDGRAHWFRRPVVDLYSGLALGVCRVSDDWESGSHDDEVDVLPAFNVNVIGIRVGKDVAGFAEIGVGSSGIITAGLSSRF